MGLTVQHDDIMSGYHNALMYFYDGKHLVHIERKLFLIYLDFVLLLGRK